MGLTLKKVVGDLDDRHWSGMRDLEGYWGRVEKESGEAEWGGD